MRIGCGVGQAISPASQLGGSCQSSWVARPESPGFFQ